MESNTLRILLIASAPTDQENLRQALACLTGPACQLEIVADLPTGLAQLTQASFDAILLDLDQNLAGLRELNTRAPELPVVALIAPAQDALGKVAVREGAQIYLPKDQATSSHLAGALHYAFTRHGFQKQFGELANHDGLTGLYNARGFKLLAEQHWRLAYRLNRPFLIMLTDLDHFHQLNLTQGPVAGDAALGRIADLLRQTFRDTDLIARLAADEFAVLVSDAPPDRGEGLRTRLRKNLKRLNLAGAETEPLTLSFGFARFNPAEPAALEDLLGEARAALRQNQAAHRTPPHSEP